jgi:hypothetical protein
MLFHSILPEKNAPAVPENPTGAFKISPTLGAVLVGRAGILRRAGIARVLGGARIARIFRRTGIARVLRRARIARIFRRAGINATGVTGVLRAVRTGFARVVGGCDGNAGDRHGHGGGGDTGGKGYLELVVTDGHWFSLPKYVDTDRVVSLWAEQ